MHKVATDVFDAIKHRPFQRAAEFFQDIIGFD